MPQVLGVGSRDLGRKAGTARSISSRRPGCTGAVDAPIGNCWISPGPLGLGLRLDEGDCDERGAARRTSSPTAKRCASNNPAAGIYTTNAGIYTTIAGNHTTN